MRQSILTQLAPNNCIDDVWEAWKLLCTPWKWKHGSATHTLEEEFRKFLGISYAYAFESGRGSLTAILQARGIGKSDEVLLQAYTCVAVPNAVLWVDATPVYADCDDQSFTLSVEDCERKVTPRTKALIIQHTFGMPADLKSLLVFAKKYNLFVIEDCAHSLGAEYYGQKVGTFGDAAFWSFGRDKCISSVFGGMVTTQHDELAKHIRNIQTKAPYPSMRWIAQQLMHPLITYGARNVYGFCSLGALIMECAKRCSLISLAVQPYERKAEKPDVLLKKCSHALAILAVHQMKKIESFNTHRRRCAEWYAQELRGTSFLLPKEEEGRKSTWLRYTIRSSKRDMLLRDAKKEGVYFGDWYTHAIAPRGVDYKHIGYDPASCPIAEKCAAESLNLPTDIHVQEKDLKRIGICLKKYL